jgi:hypothetical protein
VVTISVVRLQPDSDYGVFKRIVSDPIQPGAPKLGVYISLNCSSDFGNRILLDDVSIEEAA